MQLLILYGSATRSHSVQLSAGRLVAAGLMLGALLVLLSGTVYHYVFVKGAREGWTVISPVVRLLMHDEIAQRERFMRENLDAIAQKVGEMQAKLVRLEAMGERVIGLAGVKPEEIRPLDRGERGERGERAAEGGRGGPYVPVAQPSLDVLERMVDDLDQAADQNADVFLLMESRLLESRLAALMVPSAPPLDGPLASGFGFRSDPFTGRPALHTGLDFPAETGTPIRAAAGGVVVAREWHPGYGHLVEIDHGNGLRTRYAHCSAIDVGLGALVRRGQPIARVGSSGRSTGPHLHFEVLVDGVPQDPARFLGRGGQAVAEFARRPQRR